MARGGEQERTRFAAWVERRLQLLGLSEGDAGRVIGRRPGWLERFRRMKDARHDLTWSEGWALVELLGGDEAAVRQLMPGETAREIETRSRKP